MSALRLFVYRKNYFAFCTLLNLLKFHDIQFLTLTWLIFVLFIMSFLFKFLNVVFFISILFSSLIKIENKQHLILWSKNDQLVKNFQQWWIIIIHEKNNAFMQKKKQSMIVVKSFEKIIKKLMKHDWIILKLLNWTMMLRVFYVVDMKWTSLIQFLSIATLISWQIISLIKLVSKTSILNIK